MNLSPARWLIWSNEHNMFWRPRSLGYTSNRDEAGRYTLKEATAICDNANQCRDGKIPNEIIVPSPEVIDMVEKLSASEVTLENIAFWYMANVAGPVFGTNSAIEAKMAQQRVAAMAFAEKISKAFPGILGGRE